MVLLLGMVVEVLVPIVFTRWRSCVLGWIGCLVVIQLGWWWWCCRLGLIGGGDVGTGSVRFGGSGRSSGAVSVVGLMVDVRWLRFDYGDFPTERIFHPFLH
ncbi:unnamed protein product [Prunus armeniaca]|uniref:Uncharacterized protein n=1 Tax=Prunus armeniaca TaxID=36596 RepID=A0A6J5WHT5_PRUAR|nr:unnamed protein product [Prunus armeniaca]